jgi:hypothetical protein
MVECGSMVPKTTLGTGEKSSALQDSDKMMAYYTLHCLAEATSEAHWSVTT